MDEPRRAALGLIVGVLICGGILLFRREYATLDPCDPHPIWIRKTWWGLKTEEIYLRWMKPTGLDYEAWCAKSRRGEWYPFIVEYDGPEPEQQY